MRKSTKKNTAKKIEQAGTMPVQIPLEAFRVMLGVALERSAKLARVGQRVEIAVGGHVGSGTILEVTTLGAVVKPSEKDFSNDLDYPNLFITHDKLLIYSDQSAMLNGPGADKAA